MLLKPKIILTLSALALLAVGIGIFYQRNGNSTRNQIARVLDTFAQCLSEKGAVMYGADWCPHCQNEKKAFGDSFRFIPYVECPDDPKRCLAAGVGGFPTWIFPDGKKLVGEQGLEKLSEESGCQLKHE